MNNNKQNAAEIQLKIILDENKSPLAIEWTADSSESETPQSSNAFMLSIWDPIKKNTVRFDLWTRELMHHEMSMLIFQSLMMMSETFEKSTGNRDLASDIKNFAATFGQKAGIIRVEKKPNQDDSEIKPFTLEI